MQEDEHTGVGVYEQAPEKISERVRKILLAQPLNELQPVEFTLLPVRPEKDTQ